MPVELEKMNSKEGIRVTFIIPARNSEATIRECLTSIYGQGIGRNVFEVLLIDNGSIDRTVSIAKEFGTTVLEAPGLTVAALRNLGARNASGDILCFIDSDCLIRSDFLEKALPLLVDPKIGAAGAPPTVPENGTWLQRYWGMHRKGMKGREYVSWLPTTSLLVTQDVFQKIGGFNETLVTCEDVDLCYRIGETHKIISDPSISAVHLGEDATLWEFYCKEQWRGKGSFVGISLHGLKVREIPSFLAIAYGLTVLMLFILATIGFIFYANITLLMVFVALLVFPPLVMSIRTSLRVHSLKSLFPLIAIYMVYVAARTVSAFSRR